jgi:hypothetical protein
MVLGLIASCRASWRTLGSNCPGDQRPLGHGEFHLPNNLLVDRYTAVRVNR